MNYISERCSAAHPTSSTHLCTKCPCQTVSKIVDKTKNRKCTKRTGNLSDANRHQKTEQKRRTANTCRTMRIQNKKLNKKMQNNRVVRDWEENANDACRYENALRCMLCLDSRNTFVCSTIPYGFLFSQLITRWIVIRAFRTQKFLHTSVLVAQWYVYPYHIRKQKQGRTRRVSGCDSKAGNGFELQTRSRPQACRSD